MIIWTEKQYQAFLKKANMSEPTSEKVETPIQSVAPAMVQPQTIIHHNATNWTRPIFTICLTVIAVVGMVHEKPTNATAQKVAVAAVTHQIKTHTAHKKNYIKKKHIDKPVKVVRNDKPDIEEIESRLTTVEERLDRNGIS